MAFAFLSCVQTALLSAGFGNFNLKVKQVICLESLYLKKDLIAVLPTGYGKSLVYQVLPHLLKARDAARTPATSSYKSVVVVLSPLNALMFDQISKLRENGIKAAILGVKELEEEEETDSFVSSQWEGNRKTILEAGYDIVFCHPEAFLSCKDGLEVLQSEVYQSAVKAVVVDEAHCILEW